jgi:hypothetical protein
MATISLRKQTGHFMLSLYQSRMKFSSLKYKNKFSANEHFVVSKTQISMQKKG